MYVNCYIWKDGWCGDNKKIDIDWRSNKLKGSWILDMLKLDIKQKRKLFVNVWKQLSSLIPEIFISSMHNAQQEIIRFITILISMMSCVDNLNT